MKRTAAPSGSGRAKSQHSPSTIAAIAALPRPGPIAAATSCPVTPRANVRRLPSGSVIVKA